jgi:sugar/nucleoside kinase (ribokinase family)
VNLKQSVEYAVECASISVTRKGAQTSYPLRSELNYDYCVSSSSDPDALETLDIN